MSTPDPLREYYGLRERLDELLPYTDEYGKAEIKLMKIRRDIATLRASPPPAETGLPQEAVDWYRVHRLADFGPDTLSAKLWLAVDARTSRFPVTTKKETP